MGFKFGPFDISGSIISVSGSLVVTGSLSTKNTGSFPIGNSIGTFSSDQTSMSGSGPRSYLPVGYQAYFIDANESLNGISKIYLYQTTTDGYTKSVPCYNSPITVINKENSYTTWLAVNPSDSGVGMYTSTDIIPSHSIAPGKFADLILDTSDIFAPKWRIYRTGSIY